MVRDAGHAAGVAAPGLPLRPEPKPRAQMLAPHWTPAYIGIGSNLGDPAAEVRAAFGSIAGIEGIRLIAQSRLYRTRAWGKADQPDFVNAAAGVLSQLPSAQLLERLLALEAAAGRPVQREKWGPRILDLDLLVFGSERAQSVERQVPHPGIAERAFVLVPLREIAPTLEVPGAGRVEVLAARIPADGLAVLT